MAPAIVEASGVVPPSAIPQYLRDIYSEVKDRGPAGHILTGPIYVKGAMPGDTLEVRIPDVQLAVDYGYNRMRPYAGTTLYMPVHVAGALFSAGDGHAAQGHGEVDITAIETGLRGRFQFIVRKDMKLVWPVGVGLKEGRFKEGNLGFPLWRSPASATLVFRRASRETRQEPGFAGRS